MSLIVPIIGSMTKNIINRKTNWVAQPDGATQYWQLSDEIPIPNGGSIEFDLLYEASNQSATDYIITSEGSSDTALFFTARELLRSGSSGYISDIIVDNVNTEVLPYDNKFHTIKCVVSGNLAKVGVLGARFNYERNCSGIIKMFRVKDQSGTVINEIPLTNKSQGATQLATVGSVNATMANYTEAVWKKESEL